MAMFGSCTNFGCVGQDSDKVEIVSCLNVAAYGNPPADCTAESCSGQADMPTIAGNGYECELGAYSTPNNSLLCTLADGRTYSSYVSFSSEAVGTFINEQTNSGCEHACFACKSGGGAYAEDVVPMAGDSSQTVCEDFCSGYGYCGQATLYSDNGATNCQECKNVPGGDWLSSCTPIRWDSTTLCADCESPFVAGGTNGTCASCESGSYNAVNGVLACAD